jgi:hypothetical protein
MIFGRRTQHPLPKVPANIRSTFRNMCELLSLDEIAELEQLVEEAIQKTRSDAEQSPRIDVKLAEEIVTRCRLLLEHYEEFSEAERRLVVGAVRYFALDEDPFSDDIFASGFDDDARVMNHVLEQLGIEGMFIELL